MGGVKDKSQFGVPSGISKALKAYPADSYIISLFQAECPTINCVHLDLTDWDATRSALLPLPTMDGLVNNAAVAVVQPFLEVKPEDFDL